MQMAAATACKNTVLLLRTGVLVGQGCDTQQRYGVRLQAVCLLKACAKRVQYVGLREQQHSRLVWSGSIADLACFACCGAK